MFFKFQGESEKRPRKDQQQKRGRRPSNRGSKYVRRSEETDVIHILEDEEIQTDTSTNTEKAEHKKVG